MKKKYFKIFSKAVRRMKLKLYMLMAFCKYLQTHRFCITQVSYVADRPLVIISSEKIDKGHGHIATFYFVFT